jgi:exopolysaccharide biosynthesis polyprenyl glycosylphosphotransferase
MLNRKTTLILLLIEGGVLWLTSLVSIAVVNDLFSRQPVELPWELTLGRSFAFAVVGVTSLYFADLYDMVTLRRPAAFPERLPYTLALALCLLAALYYLMPALRLRAQVLVPCAAAAVVLLLAVRIVLGRVVRRREPERILVLGDEKLGGRLAEAIAAKSRGEHVVVGVIALAPDEQGISRQLHEAMHDLQPDRVVVATADRRVPLPLQQLLQGRLSGIAVEDFVPFYERLAGKIALDALSPGSVVFGAGFGEARLYTAFSRAVGLVAALIGLVVLAPFMALIAIAIRLTSPGPVFFVHQRVGRHGKPYGLIKLRTMHMADGPRTEWARDNDDRITPLGRWLRRFRIDELPQLINVLKGDMNLVGPRPHPVSNYLMFMERIPHYAFRSVVRPEITGWAQVRYGYANNLEQEIEKMRFDLFYIRNVSIWLDLRVLFETVLVVLRGKEGTILVDQPLRGGHRYGTLS